jgi:hypothetical protein
VDDNPAAIAGLMSAGDRKEKSMWTSPKDVFKVETVNRDRLNLENDRLNTGPPTNC